MAEILPPRTPVILVVDDEELVRTMAVAVFEDAGFEVIEAADGREAIEVLRRRPDVRAVLTDVHMPGSPDGIELARYVREVCPDCAIVVVTGRGFGPTRPELGGRVQFFSKPYRGEMVVQAVREMMA